MWGPSSHSPVPKDNCLLKPQISAGRVRVRVPAAQPHMHIQLTRRCERPSYVGNSATTFVLQLLGLETATLNTVQFSNHAGYHQLKGFRTTAAQIVELFEGLKMSGLLGGFDMMLTGYVPGAEELEAVGRVALEVKGTTARGCFWCQSPPCASASSRAHGVAIGK